MLTQYDGNHYSKTITMWIAGNTPELVMKIPMSVCYLTWGAQFRSIHLILNIVADNLYDDDKHNRH